MFVTIQYFEKIVKNTFENHRAPTDPDYFNKNPN